MSNNADFENAFDMLLDVSDENVLKTLKALRKAFVEHVEEEESDIIPAMRKAITGPALRSVTEKSIGFKTARPAPRPPRPAPPRPAQHADRADRARCAPRATSWPASRRSVP
eukprot:tig00021434_g21306.t1